MWRVETAVARVGVGVNGRHFKLKLKIHSGAL
jgi:hypothetical protein